MSESSTSSYASNANAMELAGKIMVVAILILLFVLLIVLFFHLYARWFYSRRQQPLYEITVVSYAPTRGLDPILLKALPVVKFDPEEFKHGPLLQCAVCLCEVAKGEKARLLPECDHGFHLDCIDEWFRSHSTCPLCRKPVEGFPTNESRGVSTLESCLDGGSNSSSDCNNQDCVVSEPSSSSMMMSACDRAVNGGLAIDIPRETTNEEEERKSEMPAKLRSLKRLLSGDNRRVNPSIYSDVEQGEGQS